jgi:hypothetical protein
MKPPRQIPGCLPHGYDLDSLLTVEQFSVWQQSPESTTRKRLSVTPGVIRQSRKSVRIHPRTFLELTLNRK